MKIFVISIENVNDNLCFYSEIYSALKKFLSLKLDKKYANF